MTRVTSPAVCKHDGGFICPRGTPDCECVNPPEPSVGAE